MDKILVLDFGGQYNQLIARRVRELKVYSEIKGYNNVTLEEIKKSGYKGIIFTGGPYSVYEKDSPSFDKEIINAGIPILGICYGHQLVSYLSGGKVESAKEISEYGKTKTYLTAHSLFSNMNNEIISWMSHTDYVSVVPEGFTIIAKTDVCPCAAIANDTKKIYGVQFHPEVTHTEKGLEIFRNFLFKICGCKGDWVVEDFANATIEKYREELKDKKVLLALSGGVDSSVAAMILNKAIGKNLICIFVDHGLLRKNEADSVEDIFKNKFDINFKRVDASKRFLDKLKDVEEPERKRKIIGEEFIRVFEEEANKLGEIHYLAQGTIYPDVVESGNGKSSTIKSHHNVGGLPKNIAFNTLVEPLRNLFKDEVRAIGLALGLPKELVYRQPFPGPGLAVRIIGTIDAEKIKILQDADHIFREELENSNIEELPSQYFAVLTNTKSVGVKGDARTYGYTIVIRAVKTDDFMTATFSKIPYEVLERISSRITNEVNNITRVAYDITSKPPATIEWE